MLITDFVVNAFDIKAGLGMSKLPSKLSSAAVYIYLLISVIKPTKLTRRFCKY